MTMTPRSRSSDVTEGTPSAWRPATTFLGGGGPATIRGNESWQRYTTYDAGGHGGSFERSTQPSTRATGHSLKGSGVSSRKTCASGRATTVTKSNAYLSGVRNT